MEIFALPVPPTILIACLAGAMMGFVINCRASEYIGATQVLEKYRLNPSAKVVLTIDVLFYCVFGPLLMAALYEPQAKMQAFTMGIGWPFIIRGAINTAQNMPPVAQTPQASQVNPQGTTPAIPTE